MDVVGWLLLGLILALVLYYALSNRGSAEQREVRRLIRACGGDRELAERLIFAEMQRSEGIGMFDAAVRARQRLRRDRR